MHKLTYRITILLPVVLTAGGSGTHIVYTGDFIPGTTILGMFAARYIEKYRQGKNAHQDDSFYNLFLRGPVYFGNAYIDSIDERDGFVRNVPVPLSIQREKKNKKIAFDLLFHEPANQTAPFGGFGRIESPVIYTQGLKKSLNYHHQHDPVTGTVKKGIFFNYEAIETGQTFTGDIIGGEDTLKNFKERFDGEKIFYIGRSRNTQYGKIKFEFLSQPSPFVIEEKKLKANDGKMTMTLLSSLILYNECGFPTTCCEELEKELKFRIGDNVKIEKAFIKNEDVETYVSVWKSRRPSENVFKAGSAFIISGLRENDKNKLVEIIETGIGERRKEGFGRIDFNLQGTGDSSDPGDTGELKVFKSEEKKISPPANVPHLTRKILATIIKDAFRQKVKQEALENAPGFKTPPGKSLLSKLQSILESDGMNSEKFKGILSGDLRKTAVDNLAGCNNGKQTLLDFIQKKSITIAHMLDKRDAFFDQLDRLISDTSFTGNFKASILEDGKFEEELYRIYFKTFFRTMRKRMQA